jgi:hypothetical protein
MVIAAIDINPSAYGSRNGIALSSTVLGVIETTLETTQPVVAKEIVNDDWMTNTVSASASAVAVESPELITAHAMGTLMKRIRMKQRSIGSNIDTKRQQWIAAGTKKEENRSSIVVERKLKTEHNHQSSSDVSSRLQATTTKTNRIAFGSCNEQNMKNHLWNIIKERKPSAFIWGGDAIYAGTFLFCVPKRDSSFFSVQTRISPLCLYSDLIYVDHNVPDNERKHFDENKCATPERIRQLYKKQRNNVGYKSLLEQNITIFGTIDGTTFRNISFAFCFDSFPAYNES